MRAATIHSSLPSALKDERLKDIGHSMNIGNLILDVNSVTVSHLIHHESLLQNATYIVTKCESHCITKYDRNLTGFLQNASGFLLQKIFRRRHSKRKNILNVGELVLFFKTSPKPIFEKVKQGRGRKKVKKKRCTLALFAAAEGKLNSVSGMGRENIVH